MRISYAVFRCLNVQIPLFPTQRACGLDAATEVRLARSDQAGDDDQPAGRHGRTDLAHEVALMLCLEVADALERAGEPVAGLNVGEHQLVPRLDWNRSRMRSAMM